MANVPLKTMRDMTRELECLALMVLTRPGDVVDDSVLQALRIMLAELERFVPGIEAPSDAVLADSCLIRGQVHCDWGDAHMAIHHAFRGLAKSAHHPQLWHVAGVAYRKLGEPEIASRMFSHALWIHPGFSQAKQDYGAQAGLREGDGLS